MERIIIKARKGMLQTRTWCKDTIYDFMMVQGYGHEVAADVAGWAQLAAPGEEYEMIEDCEIFIAE